jgi:hypothetical protein
MSPKNEKADRRVLVDHLEAKRYLRETTSTRRPSGSSR